MRCPKCSAPINPVDQFCTNCGLPLKPAPSVQPNYQQPMPQQPMYYGANQAPLQMPMGAGYSNPPRVKKGGVSAILIMLSALTMIGSLFLPFIIVSGEKLNILTMIDKANRVNWEEDWKFISFLLSFPITSGLILLLSFFTVGKRRKAIVAIILIFALIAAGVSGLLLVTGLMEQSSSSADYPGIGLYVFCSASLVMLISSIVYLARK